MFGEERIVLKQTEQKKKGKFKSVIINIVLLLIGAIVGWSVIFLLDRNGGKATLNAPLIIALILLSFSISFVFHIVTHELGHVIGGLLTGYGFYSYRVFSCMFVKENGKWTCKKYVVPGTLGQAIMTPPKKREDGSIPWFWYNIGGGLINILISLVVLLIYVTRPNCPEEVSIICTVFIFMGILLGLSNLIPSPSAMLANDGSNMMAMKREPVAEECFYKQLNTIAHLAENKAFRDLPLEYYQCPKEADLSCMLISVLTTYELEYYYDVEDYSSAIHLLNTLVEHQEIAKPIRMSLDAERLFLECIKGPREEVVEALYSKDLLAMLNAGKNMPDIQRVLMAYEGLYKNDTKAAYKHYEKACKLLDNYPIFSVADIERRLLTRIKEQIET